MFINLQVTHIDCYSTIGLFKVDSCFKAAGYGKEPSRGLFANAGSTGEGNLDLPLVGLIEGKATICLSQKGD